MREVSVTRPAPMRTPTIPNRGRVEMSVGIAIAVARAICAGVGERVGGRDMTVAAAMLFSRPDRSDYRKARAQLGGEFGIVESNLDRDSLYYLGEVPGGVIGRQQRKLRTTGGGNLNDFATDDLSGVFIETELGCIANLDIGQLGLAVIGLHPLRLSDERNHLRPRRHQLSGPNLALPYTAVSRGGDLGVAKVHLGYDKACLFGVQVSDELHLLGLQNHLHTSLGFGRLFTTVQHSPGLDEISVAAGILSSKTLFVSNSGFFLLLGG